MLASEVVNRLQEMIAVQGDSQVHVAVLEMNGTWIEKEIARGRTLFIRFEDDTIIIDGPEV